MKEWTEKNKNNDICVEDKEIKKKNLQKNRRKYKTST